MKIEDLRNIPNNTLSFEHREWQVDVQFSKSELSITFKYDGTINGRVTFEKSEIKALTDMLDSFYKQGKRGREFHYENLTQRSDILGKVSLSTTNWGDPYSEGIRFAFSEDFENHMIDNIYFCLEETDAKQLLEWILISSRK
jgi:hypothetical protein